MVSGLWAMGLWAIYEAGPGQRLDITKTCVQYLSKL